MHIGAISSSTDYWHYIECVLFLLHDLWSPIYSPHNIAKIGKIGKNGWFYNNFNNMEKILNIIIIDRNIIEIIEKTKTEIVYYYH